MRILDRFIKGRTGTLEQPGDPQVVDDLISRLRSEDVVVQKEAARSLGRCGDARAVEPLMDCLRSENQNLRAYAVQSLVMIGGAEQSLVDILSHSRDWALRSRLIDALTDAVRFGSLKNNPRANHVIRRAIRAGWGEVEVLSLLRLLQEAGDPGAQLLARAIDSGNEAAVKLVIDSF